VRRSAGADAGCVPQGEGIQAMTSNQAREHLQNARTQIWSIPNVLTIFRFLLIPVFVVLYVNGYGISSFITLVVSALTDVLDGRIARRYGMITNVGKVIDPVADKVTQAAMIICVGLRFPAMWILLCIHVVKELAMLGIGYRVLDKTGTVNSSKWYGKVCTALLYAVMMLHIIWPAIPIALSDVLVTVCGAMIIFCFVMYTLYFTRLINESRAARAREETEPSGGDAEAKGA
jgi:cardiolipin synthase